MRQKDLKDPTRRDELAAARRDLKDNSLMLYTASQAALQHPEVAAAKQNRDFVLRKVQDAMQRIERAVTGTGPINARDIDGPNLDQESPQNKHPLYYKNKLEAFESLFEFKIT